MSNKTLMLIVIAIIIVGAAAAGYFYWRQTRPITVTNDEIKTAQNNNQPQPEPPVGNSTATPPSLEPAAQNPAECQRNFSQSKLASDKVSITNRRVEIDVKDFGKINLEFYPSDAPKAVENFLRLTNSGYYNCLTFHRVGKNFMIQGGDPTGTGSGGESAFGKSFADELNPNAASYKTGYVKGVLAMANAGPNTNGSQFFILVADYPLDHSYTIFGHVVLGQDVADKISNVATTNGGVGAPATPVVMQSVKIIK